MADPLRGRQIHLGGQTRQIIYSMKAFRIAQRLLQGTTLRDAIKDLDVGVVIDLAAAGMAAADARVTSDRVEKWLDKEPEKFPELANAVGEAISEAYMRMVPKEVSNDLGEMMESAKAANSSPKQNSAAESETTGSQTSIDSSPSSEGSG